MPKQFITLIATGLLACGIAHAASADLSVNATIQPEACSLSLTGGGKADYGNLNAAMVMGYPQWNDTHYSLPVKSVSFTVNCSAPQAISFSTTDNRASSKETSLPYPELKHGLGMSGSQKIGFFEIQAVSMLRLFDGSFQGNSQRLFSYGGGLWTPKSDHPDDLGQTFETSFAYFINAQTPDRSQTWTGTLELSPRVAKTTVDQSPSVIQMDGSTTLSMLYP